MKSLVELAVETAMHRGELLGLRWEHIDFSNRVDSGEFIRKYTVVDKCNEVEA